MRGGPPDAAAGTRVCVWGPGTIGLLCLLFGLAGGAAVDMIGRGSGVAGTGRAARCPRLLPPDDAPTGGYDAVVDASIGP